MSQGQRGEKGEKGDRGEPGPPFFYKLEPADVIAIILVIGVVASNLVQIKQQFMVPQALLIIIGYYFGRKLGKNGY